MFTELWVKHACSSATPQMPSLGNISLQCEYDTSDAINPIFDDFCHDTVYHL